MIKEKLGKTQYTISQLAIGTVQFGVDYGFTKRKTQYEVDTILDCAWQEGINLIDTAREYGDSEKKIGDYLKRHKLDFIIATKLKKLSNNGSISLKDQILNSITESKMNLGQEKIDILQLHQTDSHIIEEDSFWAVIDSLKKNGEIGAFGISVYDPEESAQLSLKHGDKIDFFQVPYNILDRRFEKIKIELAEKGISMIGRSIFLKGIIPCDSSELPTELQELKQYKDLLEKKSSYLGMTVAELALLFVYYSNSMSSILLGVNSAQELQNNIETIKKYDKAHVDRIDISDLIVENRFLIDPRQWKEL